MSNKKPDNNKKSEVDKEREKLNKKYKEMFEAKSVFNLYSVINIVENEKLDKRIRQAALSVCKDITENLEKELADAPTLEDRIKTYQELKREYDDLYNQMANTNVE